MCTKITKTNVKNKYAYKCVIRPANTNKVYSCFTSISGWFEWLPKGVSRAKGSPVSTIRKGTLVTMGYIHGFTKASDAKKLSSSLVDRYSAWLYPNIGIIKVRLRGKRHQGVSLNLVAGHDSAPVVIAEAAYWNVKFIE